MTGKTNGTDTWTYSWTGDENRLTRVQGPGGVDVAYTYDSMGRMLTRDDGTDLTQFTWDNWDCIKEVTGASETVYHVPQGQILSFIRDGVRYYCHCDAILNVRMVTDESGDVVLRREFGAWGAEISGSFDGIPGGMACSFIGGAGCRGELSSGLVYKRQRWYDSSVGQFLSRDKVLSVNRYSYAKMNPLNYFDANGMAPDLTSTQRQNVKDAIETVRSVDRKSAEALDRANDEMDSILRQESPWITGFAEGFTPFGTIELDGRTADLNLKGCPSECQTIHLAKLLVHEYNHINQPGKSGEILSYIAHNFQQSAGLELNAYRRERAFLQKLQLAYKNDPAKANCVEAELRIARRRIVNLLKAGNVDGRVYVDPQSIGTLLP